MKTRERIGAIIIKNNRLLLLTREGFKHIWTPGGKIEKGENDEECLRRELKEEINVDLKSMRFYKEIVAPAQYLSNTIMKSRIYIASVKGDLKLNENHLKGPYWISKEDIENNKYNIMPALKKEVISKIIEDGLLK